MEAPRSDSKSNIRTTFPRIPEIALATILEGLPPDEPVATLVASSTAETVYGAIADWMLRHPSVCIGAVLPGLWVARDEGIDTSSMPSRVGSALARLSVTTWGEVMEWTPSFVWDIEGFGEGSIRPFLSAAVQVSAVACVGTAPPSIPPLVSCFERRRVLPRADFHTAQLRRFADWAISEAGAITVGDLIAACSRENLPDDIAQLVSSLRSTPLQQVLPGCGKLKALDVLVGDLSRVLNKRSQGIFFSRISQNSLRTLEDLAGELGLTRERVRQVSVDAEKQIREALATPRFAPIGWRAHALRAAIGAAMPLDTPHFAEATTDFLREVPDSDREKVLDVLLWLSGPYRRDSGTGWLCSGEIPDASVVQEFTDDSGRVDVDGLRNRLSACGLLPTVHPVWLDQIARIKRVNENWLVWTGTVSDKAARILGLWGRPATPEEIVQAIDEGHDVRATRSRMFEDERFMRVDMERVGLRSWGLEEFSTIAENIDEEIERRGGVAALGELVDTLVEKFGLREASVKLYTTAVMFVVEGGTIRRRTSADPLPQVSPITEVPGCYLAAPDTLVWRLPLSADTLRGSGRLLPSPIGAWLGVVPGGEIALAAEGGTVRVTWPGTSANGPSIGSIRFLAEALGAKSGDQGLLYFRRDTQTVALTLIDRAALSTAQGFGRLSLLTGVSHPDGDEGFLHSLGAALGVRGTRTAISSELRRRGEPDLAELVPPEDVSPELDAAIDSLKDLL